MSPRAKSASAIANDNKIRDAAIDVAHKIGLQHLRFGHIVEQTGLTTGALYSRFADHNDLLATLWIDRLREPFVKLMNDSMAAFESNDSQDVHDLAERLHKLSKVEWAAIEAVVIAHRIPELDEIVTEDVVECFSRLGLSPQYAGKDIPGLKVITALSLTFACAFNSFIDKGVQDWKSIFTLHRFVMNDLKHVENRKELSHGPLPVKAETDDELRNTLINATAEVIARSGLDGATLSRIARRARMTSGAVYTLYSTKDELIDDAITVLMSAARSDTTSLVQESQAVGDPFTSTMQVYSLAFEPSRRSFRRFRLETFTSARTDADIKSLVRGMYRQRMKEYDSMFGPDTSFSADFIRTVGRAGQMQPLGFSILEHFINTPENINMLPLSSAITRNIYNVLTHAN
jgi:AcrR family transcriptional regulator